MGKKLFPFYFLLFTYSLAQTHFTIPQNVWRISLQQKIARGNWKGHDGKNGWKDFTYQLNGTDFTVTQEWKRSKTTQTFLIEYGFTDRSTFVLNIPKLNKYEQTHSWSISSDSLITPMDDLLNQYYPKLKSNSGLGNVTMGMNVLILGNPAWRGGKNKYSLYGGIDATFPFGERLKKYYPKDVDDNGIPNQFKQLPISNGLTQWRGRVFGELYRKMWGRLINVNWSIGLSSSSREIINPPYSFLWIQETGIDSISKVIGNAVLFEQGGQVLGAIQGQMELWPQRMFFSVGMDWMASGRDKYFSGSADWNSWMVSRKNYDTKKTRTTQFIKLNFLNVDPFKQFGPVPFELELGLRWYVPFLTYHTFGYTSSWIRISSYFQAW
ncbi:MAG: hypothetical protein HOA15_02535 [Candidatus Marinimicrobia bacterium]|jgi:hypothetical protein|nr:hypothetical protein [Candidatus Neomarinimicrobiota bacterium]MBT3675110.1 hypothetical protein [Candidatus Neomarinimicrobiota bacterium]MBT3763538.1 hypothetical protein [Candidatus Neomarinimicrobiota bacterium]MBT4067573.1 hypothetical protein [Candidatus Neomarinimicrobiota bacterium]MBT4270362.1 hypothetical protein [Candidatus Neomarinimicrobiota bacterium]